MSNPGAFDPADFGLESHYSPAQQQTIRRLILEDWKSAGVKLPTYMKLLARFISSTGVPENWLGKLIHQTMDKMLKDASTPRHEFWACLHLYLLKKHGEVDLENPVAADVRHVGQALVRFGQIEDADAASGEFYAVLSEPELALMLGEPEGASYRRLFALSQKVSNEPLSSPVRVFFLGAGVISHNRLIAVFREVGSQALSSLDVVMSDLHPLREPDLIKRLRAFAEAT